MRERRVVCGWTLLYVFLQHRPDWEQDYPRR
jgi:hypothetical protein